VEDRRAALEAIRAGFCSLDLADHLEHFSGVDLATLFFGEQYLDVDALVRAFCLEGNDATGSIETWLERFVRMLSENSIRVFLARVTNKLTLPRPGQSITFELSTAAEQPRFFPVASHMQLPQCASFEAFASRMGVALRLGEYMSRTGTQNEQRLTREEERAVVAAMGGGDPRRGLLPVYLWVHLCCGRVWGPDAESALPYVREQHWWTAASFGGWQPACGVGWCRSGCLASVNMLTLHLTCSSSSSSAGTSGFLLSLTEQR